ANRWRLPGWRDLPLAWKGVHVIAIPVLCLVLQSLALMRLHRTEEDAAQWTAHTREVELESQRLLTALVDGETADLGYVITHDPSFLVPYERAEQVIPEATQNLLSLVRDNPAQTARMHEIARLDEQKLGIMRSIYGMDLRPDQPSSASLEIIRQGKATMDTLRARLAEFIEQEQRLLELRTVRLEEQRRYTTAVLWVGLGMGLCGGFLSAYLLSFGVSRRLALVQQNAVRLAQESPLMPPVGGRDEIGQLENELHRSSALVERRTAQIRAALEEIEQRRAELERANAELEAFSYSVSHDLRSPLRHIDGYSNILLEDFASVLPAEAQGLLSRIREGTGRMGRLIDELLNLGRIGRKPLRLEITGLNSLVEEVRNDLATETAGRQVEWRIAQLPFIECDAALMKQVFLNLLSNALKYSRPRAPAVITVGQKEIDGGTALFVRDNGVGFNPQYAGKLFGVFQRLHRTEDFEGTGVGLATVARILQRHGGRIWAEAELDRGATFYFTVSPRMGDDGQPALEKGADEYVHERS
ncbi:MAG TPA: CHASE3 domain-containing protein, partial [Terriglobales bacterium]|nr:CHASE3 domain-containing protein [Terriglobales bacterium]